MKKTFVDSFKNKRKKGATLIEVAAGLVVMTIVLSSIAVMFAENSDQRNAKNAAEKMTQVHEAAKGYIKANYAALMQQAQAAPVVIDAGRARVTDQPGVNSLQRLGFLPPSYIDSNPYGQQHAVIIRRVNTGPTPTLEAIVTTYGGRKIPEAQLGRVASFVGAAGGYVSDTNVQAGDQNRIVGNFGGWRSDLSNWTAAGAKSPRSGHVQSTLAFDNGNLLTDYLYRHKVDGQPDANKMFTDIDMGSNNVNNVNQITGVTSTNPKHGGQTVVNLFNTSLDLVDVWARNISGTGTLSVDGAANLKDNVTIGRNASIGGNTTVGGTLGVTGASTLNGPVKVNNVADIARLDLANTVLVDSSGANSYQNIKLKDLLPRTVAQYSYQVTETTNSVVPRPNCPSGGEQKIMIYRQIESNNVAVDSSSRVETVQGVFAENYNGSIQTPYGAWQVKWEGTSPSPNVPRSAIAQTFCSYRY